MVEVVDRRNKRFLGTAVVGLYEQYGVNLENLNQYRLDIDGQIGYVEESNSRSIPVRKKLVGEMKNYFGANSQEYFSAQFVAEIANYFSLIFMKSMKLCKADCGAWIDFAPKETSELLDALSRYRKDKRYDFLEKVIGLIEYLAKNSGVKQMSTAMEMANEVAMIAASGRVGVVVTCGSAFRDSHSPKKQKADICEPDIRMYINENDSELMAWKKQVVNDLARLHPDMKPKKITLMISDYVMGGGWMDLSVPSGELLTGNLSLVITNLYKERKFQEAACQVVGEEFNLDQALKIKSCLYVGHELGHAYFWKGENPRLKQKFEEYSTDVVSVIILIRRLSKVFPNMAAHLVGLYLDDARSSGEVKKIDPDYTGYSLSANRMMSLLVESKFDLGVLEKKLFTDHCGLLEENKTMLKLISRGEISSEALTLVAKIRTLLES